MALNKIVNGLSVPMTAEEESAFNAARVTPLPSVKGSLALAVDNRIAAIYSRWLRFEVEYTSRESAARAFKTGGYVGDPGVWVSSFSSNAGMSYTAAADLIISQADGLRVALQNLGSLRMAKYSILAATTEAAAKSAYDSINSQINTIEATL